MQIFSKISNKPCLNVSITLFYLMWGWDWRESGNSLPILFNYLYENGHMAIPIASLSEFHENMFFIVMGEESFIESIIIKFWEKKPSGSEFH